MVQLLLGLQGFPQLGEGACEVNRTELQCSFK